MATVFLRVAAAETTTAAEMCALAPPSPPATLQALMHAPQPPTLLKPGDTIEVTVYGVKDYDDKVQIGVDGGVMLPLAGKVMAGGHTASDVQSMVAKQLTQSQMLVDPQVTVIALQAATDVVSVNGEVNQAGTFPAVGQHTLLQYVTLAQGLTKTACHVVTLNRPGLSEPLVIPLGSDPASSAYANLPIFPGDSIHVPPSGVIYVVGAVKTQGAFPLKPETPTTVMQAVTLAGGVGYEARYGATLIVRQIPGGREQMNIDLKKVLFGEAPDPVLQANDIVFVPTNKLKAVIKGGGAGLAVGLASAVLYADTR